MLKKIKSRIITTVIIALAVIVFASIPVSALTFIGTAGGGAGGGSTSTNNNYSVSNTSSTAAGYRFSLIDYYGNIKRQPIDILCSSYNQIGNVKECFRFNLKFNKIQLIKNMYGAYSSSVIKCSNDASTNVYLDSDIGISLSTSPADIINTIKNNQDTTNIICQKLGMANKDDISNGDKLLVEPLFNVTLKGERHCVTVSEIGVWGGYEFGWTEPTGTAADGGASWGWIAKYTNSNYPSSLYTGATDFWDSGGNKWNSDSSFTLVNFYDCVTKGYGVGFAINNTTFPTQPTDVYPWSVALYSDAGLTNLVASVDIKGNVQGCVYEGYTYYPVYSFYNETDRAVSAYVSAYTYYWGGYYDLVYDGGTQYTYSNGYPYLWKTFAANGWQTIYGWPVTITGDVVSEAQRDGGLKYWLSASLYDYDVDLKYV